MKVYLMTDLEGVAGVWTWENRDDQTQINVEYRLLARRLLTAEVNAAVEGLFAGGATEIIVNDGHGAGSTINIEQIDPRVRLIHGRSRPFWLPLLDRSCDATVLVGAHAKAGTPEANLCHSMSGQIRNYTFNGISHGEIGMQAMIAGHFGVPMVFLCGDVHACTEVEGFIPGIVTAAVKQGLSSLSAATLAPAAARDLIRERARQAMSKVGQVAPYTIGGPLVFTEERYEAAFDPEDPPQVGTVVDPHTLRVEATDIVDLFNKLYGYSG